MMVIMVQPSNAFSLLAPAASGGGEPWQTVDRGYDEAGDVVPGGGGVANLTKEYRWNQSVITYGFDNSFINYFGTNGIAAIEAAFAVFNSLPDLSTLSQELVEYPLEDPATGATTTFRDSRRINHTAVAMNLLDMKSYA